MKNVANAARYAPLNSILGMQKDIDAARPLRGRMGAYAQLWRQVIIYSHLFTLLRVKTMIEANVGFRSDVVAKPYPAAISVIVRHAELFYLKPQTAHSELLTKLREQCARNHSTRSRGRLRLKRGLLSRPEAALRLAEQQNRKDVCFVKLRHAFEFNLRHLGLTSNNDVNCVLARRVHAAYVQRGFRPVASVKVALARSMVNLFE